MNHFLFSLLLSSSLCPIPSQLVYSYVYITKLMLYQLNFKIIHNKIKHETKWQILNIRQITSGHRSSLNICRHKIPILYHKEAKIHTVDCSSSSPSKHIKDTRRTYIRDLQQTENGYQRNNLTEDKEQSIVQVGIARNEQFISTHTTNLLDFQRQQNYN